MLRPDRPPGACVAHRRNVWGNVCKTFGVRALVYIAINAFGFDLLAASAFNGVIDAEHEDLPLGEDRDQESEQEPAGFERGPNGAVENAMIGLKMRLIGFAHDAKNRGHSPGAGCKDGTGEKEGEGLLDSHCRLFFLKLRGMDKVELRSRVETD